MLTCAERSNFAIAEYKFRSAVQEENASQGKFFCGATVTPATALGFHPATRNKLELGMCYTPPVLLRFHQGAAPTMKLGLFLAAVVSTCGLPSIVSAQKPPMQPRPVMVDDQFQIGEVQD